MPRGKRAYRVLLWAVLAALLALAVICCLWGSDLLGGVRCRYTLERLLPGGGCGACTATRPVRRSWRGKCSRRPCLLPVRARRAQTGRKCPPMLALWTLRRCAGIIRP